LRPIDVATAAVLAGVAVAVVAIGAALPRAGVLELLAAVPLAIVAARHTLRATAAAVIAGSVIAFTCAGIDGGVAVVACGVIGAIVGTIRRRGRGPATVLLLSLIFGPASAVTAVVVLQVFSAFRVLLIDSARSVILGVTRVMRLWPPAAGLAGLIDRLTAAAIVDWRLWLFVGIVVAVPVAMLGVWWLLSAVLSRLDWIPGNDFLDTVVTDPGRRISNERCAPLPIELENVRFRYPDAETDALSGVNLRLEYGQFVVVVGHNASGKSTLARVLAGAAVSGGAVRRAGAVGLGRAGGTAMVLQRPETQVLGITVREDITWGLADGHRIDVDRLLAEVGLAGMADRSTTGLSGGQLQRLAIASALARRPALLISDESTAMIDPVGRDSVVSLLASLPRRHAMTVVHVSHFDHEAARADRVVRLSRGTIVSDRLRRDDRQPDRTVRLQRVGRPAPMAVPSGAPLMRLRDIEHWYGYGTPWAHQALRHVNLDLHPGEGLLITGHNGSGKSTLAWVLAGLTRPTRGVCLLEDKPVSEQVGSVAVAFQHPRLQLQRPTVGEDICAAAGQRQRPGDDREATALVERSLRSVGLSGQLAGARIDSLSGGQMRQVALAGLLAAQPRVLILDEPLAGLAPDTRQTLRDALIGLRQQGLPLIVISHDLDGLGAACTRRLCLDGGTLR
jgi:energy-coupling factor transport system ATP-binding protein